MSVIEKLSGKLIRADSQTVYLSDETLAKQRGWVPDVAGHLEITLSEYQRLPDMVAHAQTIVQDSGQTIVFIRKENKLYRSVIKATASGESLFITSFRHTNMEDVTLTKKKGKVLKDEL
ncbi:MAG TPA: hypothetical protein PKM38_10445 [Syntrophorhabdaceae bacterium]|nr:hypothetical protein [Syntrophorhabdaceae bacterium]